MFNFKQQSKQNLKDMGELDLNLWLKIPYKYDPWTLRVCYN